MWQSKLKRFGTFITIGATFVVTIFLLASLQLPAEPFPFRGSELAYKPGVKAALFALASGALFVVSWLPEKEGFLAIVALWMNRTALAGTFFLTGWYWLRSAVYPEEAAWGHLSLPLFATALFCVSIVAIIAFLFLVGYSLVVLVATIYRWFKKP